MDLEFLLDLGYVGLFIGTFIAATVVPFSSDFLIVGILIAGGDPLISWICATAGNWLGGLTSDRQVRFPAGLPDMAALCRRRLCHRPRLLQAPLRPLRPLHAHRQGHPLRLLARTLLHFRRHSACVRTIIMRFVRINAGYKRIYF